MKKATTIFDVNFERWVLQMLPTFKRSRLIFALCCAMCAPVVSLYRRFMEGRRRHNYRLSHNGQVCYLRAALNDAFNTKGFEIRDFKDEYGEWHFAKDEDPPNDQLYAVSETLGSETIKVPILYDEISLNAEKHHFSVHVPSDLRPQIKKVKSIVDKYRLISKIPDYGDKE